MNEDWLARALRGAELDAAGGSIAEDRRAPSARHAAAIVRCPHLRSRDIQRRIDGRDYLIPRACPRCRSAVLWEHPR